MNLLTPGVTKGMVEASSHLKHASVSMAVYENAKNRGDTATMDRAMGYASDSMDQASKSGSEAQEALKQAQEEAKELKKTQDKAALEEQRPRAAVPESQRQVAGDPAAAAAAVSGNYGAQALTPGEAQITPPTDAVAAPDKPAADKTSEMKIYTVQGIAKPMVIEPHISVTV